MSDLEQALNSFYAEEYTQALSLLKPLAEKENAEAQCIIGNIYHLGLSVERNILEAIKWYIKAAENGNAVAANNLAGIYLSGDEGVAVNQAEADKWFEIARKQGFLHTPVSNDYLKLAGIA
jgi:TPR repeat protein